MVRTNPKLDRALEEYKSGKSASQILKDNPDISKSSLHYRINKSKSEDIAHRAVEPEPNVQTQASVQPEPQTSQVNVQHHPVSSHLLQNPSPLRNETSALNQPPQTSQSAPKRLEMRPRVPSKPSNMPPKMPSNIQRVDRFATGERSKMSKSGDGLLDNLFGDLNFNEPSYNPSDLARPAPSPPSQNKSLLSKGKSFWFKPPKEKTPKETEEEEENERLVLIQKIRLYFHHFSSLQNLHIVPNKRNSETKDLGKFLEGLYSKKKLDLEKMLHFVKFHVRNQINENTSNKVVESAFQTSIKVLEHLLLLTGLRVGGLTSNVMSDPDIQRCLKEIMIDKSIHTMNFSPGVDLALKVGMGIIQTDASNRITESMVITAQARVKIEEQKKRELDEQYCDL